MIIVIFMIFRRHSNSVYHIIKI